MYVYISFISGADTDIEEYAEDGSTAVGGVAPGYTLVFDNVNQKVRHFHTYTF